MGKYCFAIACVVGIAALPVMGQARSTASRSAALQVGVGFTVGRSDYDPKLFKGGTFYTTLDLTNHLGAEFDIHQMYSSQNDQVYERTYELGARYFRTYGRLKPYAKLMYGRGVFNFPYDVANLAYNIFTGGAGVDFEVRRNINLRVDYEYQDWLSFPPHGLTPQVVTVGVAFHFPGGLQRGKHY